MKRFRQRHPIWMSFLLLLLFILAQGAAQMVLVLVFRLPLTPDSMGEPRNLLLSELPPLLVLVLFTFLLGMGYVFRPAGRPLHQYVVPALPVLLIYTVALAETLIMGMGLPLEGPGRILIFTLAVLAAGFTEELLCRALITRMMVEKFGRTSGGLWFSVLLGSLMFGAMHLMNMTSGASAAGAMIQASAAIGAGIFFSALYLRTGSYWVCGLVHGYMDFCAMAGMGLYGLGNMAEEISSYSVSNLLGGLIYAAVGFFLLRPSKMKTMTNLSRQPSERILLGLMLTVMLLVGLFTAAFVVSI